MGELLDLIVIVSYYGTKAQNFYAGSPTAIDILLEDLVTLKLPHPKREKIVVKALPHGRGQCSFVWPAVPIRSVLHKHLSSRICGQDTVGARKLLLKELSIGRLSLRECPAGTVRLDPHINEWRRWDGAQAEAQMLLDNMASALRHPKSEPIEPTLPDSPARESVASSIPSLPPPPSRWNPHNSNRVHESPMSISSSTQPTPRPIKALVGSPTIPSLALRIENADTFPPGLTFSTCPTNDMHQNTQLPSPSTTSHKRSRSDSPEERTRRPPPGANLSLNGNGQSMVDQLKAELSKVRRQIEADVAREASLLSEIQALGSTVTSRETSEDAVLRGRLGVVEAELRAETRLREEAEAALVDFQRECKEPFIVPAMFDVVETLSRLTSQVMDVIKAEAGAA